ncbi:MAG: hypothetical protein JRF55_14690, partial [Deltaproteobacteria bacterium]|nr:hypothetical protein [Deltaproteobacteria bacterium]
MGQCRARCGTLVVASWQRILLIEWDSALFGRIQRVTVEVGDDAGNVVMPPARVGKGNQAIGKLRQRANARHFLLNRLVVNETAQTIRAEEHPITAPKLD